MDTRSRRNMLHRTLGQVFGREATWNFTFRLKVLNQNGTLSPFHYLFQQLEPRQLLLNKMNGFAIEKDKESFEVKKKERMNYLSQGGSTRASRFITEKVKRERRTTDFIFLDPFFEVTQEMSPNLHSVYFPT